MENIVLCNEFEKPTEFIQKKLNCVNEQIAQKEMEIKGINEKIKRAKVKTKSEMLIIREVF